MCAASTRVDHKIGLHCLSGRSLSLATPLELDTGNAHALLVGDQPCHGVALQHFDARIGQNMVADARFEQGTAASETRQSSGDPDAPTIFCKRRIAETKIVRWSTRGREL